MIDIRFPWLPKGPGLRPVLLPYAAVCQNSAC